MTPDSFALLALSLALAFASFRLSPKAVGPEGFFGGRDAEGNAPGLWTLVFSQVTTWIFARSLLTAAVLGFYYGAPGALAYAAYYVSFLTGGLIVDRLRFRHGSASVQAFLSQRHGRVGTLCYNIVIALRLLSEVFANLLVVGTVFATTYGSGFLGNAFPGSHGDAGSLAIIVMAVVALSYSMNGGLRASLRTDVFQMMVFLVVLGITLVALFSHESFDLGAALSAPGVSGQGPGWVLLAVAALQVLSYPLHDPVMMDRGFLADRARTRRSFLHAFWISALCIFGFGLLGVQAGLLAGGGEGMQAVWGRMFGPWIMVALNTALIVSAISTLDSTLSSASRLAVEELGWLPRTLRGGRIAMLGFTAVGTLFCFYGSKDLYTAVAVSGAASLYLAPVILFSILGPDRPVPLWSYLTAFGSALGGAILYFFASSRGGVREAIAAMTGLEHKYSILLAICVTVLAIGCAAFWIGQRRTGSPR